MGVLGRPNMFSEVSATDFAVPLEKRLFYGFLKKANIKNLLAPATFLFSRMFYKIRNRCVLRWMIFATRQFKIIKSVVKLITILMVHYLAFLKPSSEMLFHNIAVLKNLLSTLVVAFIYSTKHFVARLVDVGHGCTPYLLYHNTEVS